MVDGGDWNAGRVVRFDVVVDALRMLIGRSAQCRAWASQA